MKKLLLSLLLSSAVAAPALADSAKPAAPAEPAVAPMSPVLMMALQGGLTLVKSFPAEGGLTGHILAESPAKHLVVYTPASGDVIISGAMVNSKGENLTALYLEQYAPKPDYDRFLDRLKSSGFIAEGASDATAKSTIYVFKDANCGFCHLAWQAFQPYMAVGLQVRWVPVAFLGSDSANKAAALMQAEDKGAALAKLHAEFGKKSSFSATPVTSDIKRQLEANAKLMAEMGFRGTPATLYVGPEGKLLAMDGMPRLGQLPSILNLPEQKNTNPALARFE